MLVTEKPILAVKEPWSEESWQRVMLSLAYSNRESDCQIAVLLRPGYFPQVYVPQWLIDETGVKVNPNSDLRVEVQRTGKKVISFPCTLENLETTMSQWGHVQYVSLPG